jgi:AcrR family transcriptional regulator
VTGHAGPPGQSRARGRYHHGDLRAALIDTAIELLAEHGPRGFTMAEASRRLGVATSAPYRHFDDRDALLAAVAVRAAELLAEYLAAATNCRSAPERLAAAARAYVRFAYDHRPLFQALSGSGLDKARHPRIDTAAQPIYAAFLDPAAELAREHPDRLASAIVATAHGHATLMLDDVFGTGEQGRDTAADQAVAAVRALIAGSRELAPRHPC